MGKEQVDIEDVWAAQDPPPDIPPEVTAYFDDLLERMQAPGQEEAVRAAFARFGSPAVGGANAANVVTMRDALERGELADWMLPDAGPDDTAK